MWQVLSYVRGLNASVEVLIVVVTVGVLILLLAVLGAFCLGVLRLTHAIILETGR